MSYALPVCTGLCLLLGACAGSGSNASAAIATAGGVSFGGTLAAGGASSSGGTGASGGSSVVGGAGAVGQGGSAPSKIDLSIWSLQLPTGSGTSPTTIPPSQLTAGYTDDYFYLAVDGGETFMDPQTGTTTSGSLHCRTEMREDDASGAQAAWSAAGTNTMTVAGKVIQVGGGSSGHVTVGQVFNGTDSIPLCELSYSTSTGGFESLYEEAKGSGTTTDLNSPVALNTQYTFTLALSNGVLTVAINGKAVYSHTPSAGIAAKKFYFKFGNYDQTATAGAVSTAPYTLVEVYGVSVVHE
jgi:Alginate lyase